MKNLITILSLVVFLSSCDSLMMDPVEAYQPKQHKGKYEGQFEEGSTVLKEYYHQTIERTVGGKYIRKQFFPPNKQITHFETYADKNLQVREGVHKEWADNGNVYMEGQYKAGIAVGEWKQYSLESGKLSTSGMMVDGEKSGIWKSFYEDGNVNTKYNYLAGKREGAYQLFNKKGEKTEEGTYRDGEIEEQNILIKPESQDEEFKVVEEMPLWKDESCIQLADQAERKKCGETKMLHFIYSDIKYPRFARKEGIEGKVIAGFVVDKEGNVIDRKIYRGVCQGMSDEVARIIDTMPKWVPGKQNGKPVKVLYTLPVKFKFQ